MPQESYLYKKIPGGNVQCQTCNHYCRLSPEQTGICGVRQNQDGALIILNYGRAIAVHIDPIEKKPLYHFLPGTQTFSFAAAGCNFRCANCQNWEISQLPKNKADGEAWGEKLSPAEIVEQTINSRCPSVSYTYTEPTIFLEYALDTMKLARAKSLKNIWVSNGYFSPESLKLIAPYLDAANIDLKSFDDKFYQKNCGARLQPVLDNLKALKKLSIHFEITTLAIPTLSGSELMFEQIACFIKKELGEETPWHISRFSPIVSWQQQNLSPTPLAILQKARRIALTAGLKNVYLGNV